MRTESDGFSLIETLIATAVFLTAIAAVLQLVTLGIEANLGARRRTAAAVYAAQKVEELLALPWGTEPTAADARDGYAREWVVRPLPRNPASAIAIDVRVTFGGVEQARLLAVKVRQSR